MRIIQRKNVYPNCAVMASQRGVVVPIVAIGLLAILAVAGLALDGSHALGNKTRMQNTVDAAALAAAKVLDDTDGDIGLATAAANSLFSINADGDGNHELNDAYDAGDITVTVQYSTTVNPFVPGSPNGPFVRVRATGFDTQTTLSRVLGIADIPTPATAVAGPSGPLGTGQGSILCDIAPIAVCEDDLPPAFPAAQDVLRVLKPNPGTHGDIGPGNYKMLRLDDCSGGACLRQNMAGSYEECLVAGDTVETEPGVSSGPVSQGFNTRFNQYQGAGLNPVDFPPDKYVSEQDIDNPNEELKACEDPDDPLTEYIYLTDSPGNNYCNGFDPDTWPDPQVTTADDIPYNYDDYSGDPPGTGPETSAGSGWEPLENRRLLKFPLIQCDGDQNGQSTLYTGDFACFFMVQSLEGGQADGAGNIFGQFIGSCPANGTAGINPGGGPPNQLLYKIQLYKDPDSGDS
mgnify:CR=1 FL=1